VRASTYQSRLADALKANFPEVQGEWSVARDATDGFRDPAIPRYAPRLDIAIGPFNITAEAGTNTDAIRQASRNALISGIRSEVLVENSNPRCLLAIEIEFSGSSKHILGGITNASMMGLIGIVIGSNDNIQKIRRIHEYVKWLRQVGKGPTSLFGNVATYEASAFYKMVTTT
jgi:hypothetical protein